MAQSVQVVIVNWNAGAQLLECVNSLSAVDRLALAVAAVTVVDNASSDGSIDALNAASPPLPLRVVRNAVNRGFAAACNQGAAGSEADFLLFLNPDTVVSTGALETCAAYLADPAHRDVGIVGVQLVDQEGAVARSCARRPTAMSLFWNSLGIDRLWPGVFLPHFLKEWPHDETMPVDQVMGAFFFVRRPLFEQLKGFDEHFFVYFEDLDFALRAQARGWKSVYLASAHVFHRGEGTTRSIKGRRLYYQTQSKIIFGFKHFGVAGGTVVAVGTLVFEPLVRVAAAFLRLRFSDLRHSVAGFAMLWAHLPDVYANSRAVVRHHD